MAGDQEYASTLAVQAIANLAEQYHKDIRDVDFILAATTTSDFVFPSVACQIQQHFHIQHTGAIDLNATCPGFTYGLHLANGLITSGLHRKILVVAAETLSKVTDYTDRTTCILFGDGAAAVLVEREEERTSFIASHTGPMEKGASMSTCRTLSHTMFGNPLSTNGKIVQNGREVYQWVTRTIPIGMNELLQQANLSMDELDWFVPHSANL